MSTADATAGQPIDLLIVGAGPFGLALAAEASHRGIAHRVVGRPMEFWREHMPAGMILRSAGDWHLDPQGVHTIERYLAEQGKRRADVEPLSLAFYLSYAEWFRQQKGIAPLPLYVSRLDAAPAAQGFVATLENGQTIAARNVALAIGFGYFANAPAELTALFPKERVAHTCDLVDLAGLAGRRCLILGGRQSAFEWAALLHEAGASAVHIVHRHPSPAFAEADWSWVPLLMERMLEEPGWFRDLPPAEQEALNRRLWSEGRLKVEPWLAPRLAHETVRIWPSERVMGCVSGADGALEVELGCGASLTLDQVIMATGYKVDLARVPFLASGDLLPRLVTRNGFPALDDHFQTSLPGLFASSMMAAQDFGSFLAFTVSARAAATTIGAAIARRLGRPSPAS